MATRLGKAFIWACANRLQRFCLWLPFQPSDTKGRLPPTIIAPGAPASCHGNVGGRVAVKKEKERQKSAFLCLARKNRGISLSQSLAKPIGL